MSYDELVARIVALEQLIPHQSKRVYPLLKTTDLDSATFAQIQGTGNPIHIADTHKEDLEALVLTNLARLSVAGEWDGLLSASVSSDASFITATSEAGLSDDRVLTAGSGITLTDGGAGSTMTVAASGALANPLTPPFSGSPTTNWAHLGAPYGNGQSSTTAISTDQPIFFPFVHNKTGTVDTGTGGALIAIQSAGAGNALIGMYSDSGGKPDDLQLEASIDISATSSSGRTGDWSVASGGSDEVTQGQQMWMCVVREDSGDNFTAYSNNRLYSPGFMRMGTTYNTIYGCLSQTGSNNALPATASVTTGFGVNAPAVGWKYD